MKNSIFNAVCKTRYLALLVVLILTCGNVWGADVTGTINFGSASGSTNINAASVTGDDSQDNTWTVTTVGTTSFTPNASYAQVGSSSKPATSITFTTTLESSQTITSMSAKFGGFSNTAGTVTLKVGDYSIGTGSLNGTSDVTVNSTDATKSGTVLTVTVTGISKGVKCYYISYTYSTGGGGCDKKVTISKGTPETGGSFDLDKTGEQDCCSALTVTVSNITAPNGKRFSAITQSGIASGVTIDQNAKTVTYAANSTGTSTINVTFESKGCTDHYGTNVTSGSTQDNKLGPCATYYKYSTRQILYTKTDLNLGVGKKGTIKSISFDYATASDVTRNVTIYMANTSLTSLSNTAGNFVPFSEFTQVYTGSVTFTAGYNEIELSSNYEYNGIGNLVVLIDDNTGSYVTTDYFNTHTASTITGNAQIWTGDDDTNQDPSATSWTGYTPSTSRPNTKFCIQEADMTPATVTLMDNSSTLTEASAGAGVTLPSRTGCTGYTFAGWTKSWTSAQTSWTTTAPTIIPAGSYIPAGNENLYPVYTKTDGGGGSTTKTYGWENTEPDASYWTIDTYPEKNDGQHHTGSYAGRINTNNTYVTFNEKVKVTEFSFYFTRTSNNNNYNVYIETSTDGSSWSAAETFAMSSFATTVSWQQCSKTWDGTTAYYVRFHCYNTTAVRWVDDISITYSGGSTTSYISVPNCCTELGTINGSVSFANPKKAVLVWDAIANVSSWTVKWKTGEGSYATTNVSGVRDTLSTKKTCVVTGLSCNTAYDFKIIANPASGYCDKEQEITNQNSGKWSVTYTLSNASKSSGQEPGTGVLCGDLDVVFAASSGYVLPNSITVSGASSYTWTQGSGTLHVDAANITGNVTVTITATAAANFINGETVFIQADSKDYSAWKDDVCVKAWFNASGAGGAAQTTYWLFDATDTDAGKKLFATIVPSTGNLNQVTVQRFQSDCDPEHFYNNNGTLTKAASGGVNTFRSYGSADNNLAWNGASTTLSLYGSQNSWGSSLATFADQGSGVWTATISNYAPDATSKDYKIKTSYNNGWIGNTNSNNDATLSGMIVGSTYNVTATLDVTDHSLVMSKTFVKGTVHFDMQSHGSQILDLTNVTAGSTISAPTAPTAEGYVFGGWFKEPACTNEWNFASDVVNETMTLYAKWTYIPTITFSVPTGATAPSSQLSNVTLPSPTGFPNDISSDCWAFAGWTESSTYDGTGKPATFYPAGTTYNGSQTVNFTLYAVYSRNKFLVVYDNSMLTANADYVITDPTLADYHEYALTGTANGNNAEVVDVYSNAHDMELGGLHYYTIDNPSENAVWTLTGSAGSWVLQNKATSKYLDLSSTSSPMIANASTTLAITEGTGEDEQTYSLTKSSNHLVIGSSAASVATGDATYYWLYKLISSKYMTTPAEPTYTVTWKVYGQADQTSTVNACSGIQAGDIPSAPADNTLASCATNGKFMGWSATNVGSSAGVSAPTDLFTTAANAPYLTGDKTLYAVFAEEVSSGDDYYAKVTSTAGITNGRYLIVYEDGSVAFDGGLSTLDAVSNTIDVTIEDDKITASSTTEAAEFTIASVTGGYTIKSASGYYIGRLSTETGNGLSANTSTEYVNTLSIVSDVAVIQSAGNTYLKFNSASNQNRYRFYGSGQQDIQLYKFIAGTTYGNYRTSCNENEKTVVYNAGEGGTTDCSNATITKGSSHTVCSTTPTRNYYTFQGWTADVDVTINSATVTAGTIIAGGSVIQNIQTNIALTASWTPTAYTITYNNLNGATNPDNPATYTYVTPTITLQDPGTRAGYIFKGWYDDAVYTNQVTQIANGSSGNINVYAKWATGYTITWNNAIGDNPASTQVEEGHAIGTLPIPTGSCTSDGVTYSNFVGWYTGTISGVGTAASDAGTEITSATVPTASATYHAVYTNIPDYSGTHTSNVTLPEVSTPKENVYVKVSDDDDAPQYEGIKIGTSKNSTGSFTFTVPSGTTKITVHATGWSGKTTSLTLATSVGTISPSTAQSLTSSTGAANNSPFTITSGITTLNFTLSGVNSAATITLSNGGERVIVWGINASTSSGSTTGYITQCCDNVMAAPTMNTPTVRTSTAITLSWNTVTNATGYKVAWNGGDWEDVGTATTYAKTSLEPGTDYAYKVVAKYPTPTYCGASVYEGVVSTKPVFTVTYLGGSGTGTCNADHVPTDATTYEQGATVTLPATSGEGAIHLTGHTFAAWTSEQVALTASSTSFVMPASNVTVTATWTAKQDKYYDRMHDLTSGEGSYTDAQGKHYIVREGCHYTVPTLSNSTSGGTACHTSHYVLMGWAAEDHIQQTGADAGKVKSGHEGNVFTGGGQKSATGANYYAIWAEVTE